MRAPCVDINTSGCRDDAPGEKFNYTPPCNTAIFFFTASKLPPVKLEKLAPAFIPAEKFWANDVEETKIIKAKIIFFIISNFKIEILSHFYNIKNLQPF